ncbi:polar amino acid ABC transport permease protein aapM-1 [Fulvimarina pelagi HTCC2506]|uniref:Polar amino acid ABC transport permease protein aapM-1 n=1 Tax=Fulvimarina pelagi HTCC2506 TaxID=314231 RepID=Q0G1Y9_9HYPH|nr:amino acid ABC transporter permease [Fulvimarina pelagi]EAU41409.1 polar amino acid ABC transport permease protein aapM-1 [Fulvimarina pelagi HTCC2506]
MQEHANAYVSTKELPQLPAPRNDAGPIAVLRKNLFATPVDTILTLVCGLFIVWAIWNLFSFVWLDAVFEGADREACLVEGGGHGGACWAFVEAKLGQFVYGTYPSAERWRVDTVFLLLALLTAGLLIPNVPYKRINAILLFAVFPVVTLVLLTGGEFELAGGAIALVFVLAAAATLSAVGSVPRISLSRLEMRIATWLLLGAIALMLIAIVLDTPTFEILGFSFSLLTMLAFVATLGAIGLSMMVGFGSGQTTIKSMVAPLVIAALFIFAMTADFDLRYVPTNLWGGLMLTLVVALSGIAASLPFGVLLALGRRSHMPAVRLICVIFIEFWRGVPLITVLFMATFMLPLFMPEGVNFNSLLRALVGVALFASAYMAEVVRGGLQAIPKGQYEGADAMALSYWQKTRLIILPQALKIVIPGIVNTFIGLFKDTSLVYIIGLADLLGTVKRGFADPNWITPTTPATGLLFAAFVYWCFCFGMSRYSIFVERRLDTGHKR